MRDDLPEVRACLPTASTACDDADACPVVTCGGGFAVPNFTSKLVAPDELHVSVGLVLTPVAPFAGDGVAGVPGAVPPLEAVTATESNVAVLSCPVLWLVTTRPTLAVVPSVTLVLPTVVHVEPSADTKPVTVEPDRTSFSHDGTGSDAPASQAVEPPSLVRVMNSMLPPGCDVDDDVRRGR